MTHPHPKFNPDVPPPPLLTSEPDSFARHTITTRKPKILNDVLTDHQGRYPAATVAALEELLAEIVNNQPFQPLRQTTAPDYPTWAAAWQQHRHESWLNTPWYFAEVFFYRRLLDITGYFGSGPWAGVDPFLPRKQAELAGDTPWQLLTAVLSQTTANHPDSLRALLQYCLWGNRVDLSQTKIIAPKGGVAALEHEQNNLLVNDTETVVKHLEPPVSRVDFICDNSGTELLLDLALADFLLRTRQADRLTLHVKAHPTFVSDTIPADVTATIAAMQTKKTAALIELGNRLEQFQQARRLLVQADYFWNSPGFFWQMPPALTASLAQARLVIIKGDANYRRLLGDSRWPATAVMADLTPYFPAPFVALRTLKSDPIVGLPPNLAESLTEQDPTWRVNGQRGVIQANL